MSQISVPFLFVLDLNTDTAIQYTLNPEHHDMDVNKLLNILGHRPENCRFMFSYGEIEKRESEDYDLGVPIKGTRYCPITGGYEPYF